ncbi:glycosyltransferase family 39 protein [Candidatus Micrarchaeota archaeon]|nr:glycosyltransferase family 39 protein [Candidatus Micrarchaeota archaeon]
MNADKKTLMMAVGITLGIAGFLLSTYTTSGNAAFWWDEAEYGILAKGVTSGFFSYFGAASYRPPFLPVYDSIFAALFGKFGTSLIIPLFSFLSIASVYMIGKRMFDFKTGVIASLMLMLSTLYVFYSGRFLTEIPGIFFSAISIYFFYNAFENGRKRDFLLLAIFTACSFMVFYRFSMMMVSFGVFALLCRPRKIFENIQGIAIALGALLALLFPLLLYSNSYFGSPIGLFSSSYTAQQPEPLDWFIQLSSHIFSNTNVLILLVLSILYAAIFGKRELKYLAMLNVIVFISASILLNHKEDRYLMPMFPVAFLAIGAFSSQLITNAIHAAKSFNTAGNRGEISAIKVFAAIIAIALIYNATFANLPAAFSLYDSKKASFGDVKMAAVFLRDNSNPSDIIISDSPTAIYHSERNSKVGFNGGNITAFLNDMSMYSPKFILLTVYESRENYINAVNNFKNLKTAGNSVEYVLLHPEKYQLMKVFPNDQNPNVLVFKVL